MVILESVRARHGGGPRGKGIIEATERDQQGKLYLLLQEIDS